MSPPSLLVFEAVITSGLVTVSTNEKATGKQRRTSAAHVRGTERKRSGSTKTDLAS